MASYPKQPLIQAVESRAAERINPWMRFLHFALTRILLGILVLVVVIVLGQAAMDAWQGPKASPIYLVIACAAAALCSLAYFGFVRLIEGRPVTELAFRDAAKELLIGLMISTVIFLLTIAVLWAAGSYRVSGLNAWTVIFHALALAVFHGVFEELLVRGIVFRITEESLGTWLALLLSAMIFGSLHLANPNATLWGAAAIAIEAGIPLAATFVLTRRLWMAIGMHVAWNFVQAGIFGVAVSGYNVTGLLRAGVVGPDLLTGGAFGVEASLIVVAACMALGFYLLRRARRAGGFIDPFWTRAR